METCQLNHRTIYRGCTAQAVELYPASTIFCNELIDCEAGLAGTPSSIPDASRSGASSGLVMAEMVSLIHSRDCTSYKPDLCRFTWSSRCSRRRIVACTMVCRNQTAHNNEAGGNVHHYLHRPCPENADDRCRHLVYVRSE